MKPSEKFPATMRIRSGIMSGIDKYDIVAIPEGIEFYAKVKRNFEVEVEFRDEYVMHPEQFSPSETSQLVTEIKNRLGALVEQSCITGKKYSSLAVSPPVYIHGVVRFVSVFWSACDYKFQGYTADDFKLRHVYADSMGSKALLGGRKFDSTTMQIVVIDMVHGTLKLERGYIPRRVELERIVGFFNELSYVTNEPPEAVRVSKVSFIMPEGGSMLRSFTVPRIINAVCRDYVADVTDLTNEAINTMGIECKGLRMFDKESSKAFDIYV